ncbi:hypothetical protein DV737_g3349, partial [Chaetothyriales sp. CBS 132003]
MRPDSPPRETTESRIRVHQIPLASYHPTTSNAGSSPVLKHRLPSAATTPSEAVPDRPEKRMRLGSRDEHDEAESWRLGAVPPSLFELQFELSRLVPSELPQKAAEIRCNTLDKKSQVSDHEINTLTEEKIRLQQQLESLEAQVEELQKSRDEVNKQSSADGAQWRQIMAMSSQLQIKSVEEARQFKTEREAWDQEKASLQRRIQDLEDGRQTMSTMAPQSAISDAGSTADDTLTSMSVEALRQEALKLRARCAKLELILQDISSETELLDKAISAMTSIKQRLAHSNARWLSDANTNARVYRCHSDRVKRVVTESSPFLFLTCSEDGEVRQWDLRLPSSAYPAPRGGRSFARHSHTEDESSDNVPPPLISYKKYGLDLNSISCAASRPHYIALGGTHLHCFLHDRRMLGRDIACEAGQPGDRTPIAGTHEDEAMSSATRCVKRFAPNERRRMISHDHSHITACKISDANPNEMVASWSGDHVYSFDLVKSPDARDADAKKDQAFQATRLKNRTARKRKRKHATASSSSLADNPAPSRRVRRVSDSVPEAGQTALRVRDSTGDGDDILLVTANEEEATDGSAPVSDVLLSEAQVTAEIVARCIVRLRKTLFDFEAALREESLLDTAVLMENSADLTPYTGRFTDALGQCASLLPQLDEIIRGWSYPVAPTSEEVTLQNALRRNRQATWRFVQASGCLSYVLGGQLQRSGDGSDPRLHLFSQIRPAVHEGKTIRRDSMFCYDFLKAILCWIDGGVLAVLHAFTRPPSIPPESPRFPLSDSDTVETFVPKLHQYLYELADDSKAVIDLDRHRFEHDERRQVFQSQKSAVQAFTRALSGIELRVGQGASIDMSTASTAKRIMDKGAAARFWAVKVGRSLLMEAAEGVTFDFVNRAYGGLRLRLPSLLGAERSQEDIDPDEHEHGIERASTMRTGNSDTGSSQPPQARRENAQAMIRRRIALSSRSRERALVNIDVPYSSHSQSYKGHCNTRTVKDVNYYGLNDEDRKSGKIVNILEGDVDVVNVIQGHPYEPMIACSGIDSTIKIFGPGGLSRERRNAARGIDIANPSGGSHLPTPFGQRRRMRRAANNSNQEGNGREGDQSELEDEADGPQVRRGGLASRRAMHRMYQITSQNDVQRQRGLGDVFMTEEKEEKEEETTTGDGDDAAWVRVEELPLYLQHAISEPSLLTACSTSTPTPRSEESGPRRVRVLDLEEIGGLKAKEERRAGLLLLRHSVTQAMGRDGQLRPELILKRARCHEALGYDELAVGDAYAAFTLASGESEDLVGQTVAVRADGADGADEEEWDVDGHVAAGVRAGSVRILVEGLRRLGAVGEVERQDLEGIYGRCQRVVYPWNSHEPERMSAASLGEINARLQQASDGMLECRKTVLPSFENAQLGLFATRRLGPSTAILRERSCLSAIRPHGAALCDCCAADLESVGRGTGPAGGVVECPGCGTTTLFCSRQCCELAAQSYHRPNVGGEDEEAEYAPASAPFCGGSARSETPFTDLGRAESSTTPEWDLYFLLVVRCMQMAITQDVHPLDLFEVKYLWGGFSGFNDGKDKSSTEAKSGLPFSFHHHISLPFQLFESLQLSIPGVHPYSGAWLDRFDWWTVNTLYAKFRGVATASQSRFDGRAETAAVHALWCLANHSCAPNVEWEAGGGERAAA